MKPAAAHSYTATAKLLHWLMALLLAGMVALGFYMKDLAFSPEKLQLYSWHKWAGVSAFLLVLVRFAWRVTHRPPELPEHMSSSARRAAHAGHLLIYALMTAIPLTGWLMSSAKGFQTVWFGVLPLPDLLEKNLELGDALARVHGTLNVVLVAMVVGHVAAAVWHQVVARDGLLTRMLPSR